MKAAGRAAAFGLVMLALALPGAAGGQQDEEAAPGLTITPSRVEATAQVGLEIGPFGFSNGTELPYDVRVFPVLLGQDREGGIIVDEDEAALEAASDVLRADTRRFELPPGAEESVAGEVKRIPGHGNFYGGLLFEAEPTEIQEDQQVVEILRLNGSVLLHPPADEREVRLGAEAIRAEQLGERIQLLVPIANEGNVYAEAGGRARVIDAGGTVRATERLERLKILPGATVELPARIGEDLEAGTYDLEATVTMAGESVNATGTMELAGTNQVTFVDAELVDLPNPEAFEGEPVEIEATYRNTGNTGFVPEAIVEARALSGGDTAEVVAESSLEVEEAGPGDTANVTGEVELPAGADSYELEVSLLDEGRVLDSRSVNATPGERPGLLTRIGDFITENAVVLVLVLLASLLLGAILAWRYLQRLRAQAGTGRDGDRSQPGSGK